MKYLASVLIIMGMLNLTACNTMQGLGQDIQKGGKALEKSAS